MRLMMLLVLCVGFLCITASCKPGDGNDAATAAELEKMKLDNSIKAKQIEDLRRELDIAAKERDEWRDKHNGNLVRLQEAENIINKLRLESVEARARIDELEKKYAALEGQRGTLENELKGLEGVKVTRKGDEICLTVEDKILFDSGKADVKSSANKTLKTIADAIAKGFKDRSIRVEGHTDSDPIVKARVFASNWELSSARAANVLHALVKAGLPESKFSIAGFAALRPVAKNDTPENKARNRRVEIYILGE